MPLIKASPESAATQPDNNDLRRERLAGDNVDDRRNAARALGRDPSSIGILAGRLQLEKEPRVRDALFGSLIDTGGKEVADLLAQFIRSEDAGLRNGAIEALKRLEGDAVVALDLLIEDANTDVRILAIEVTRAWPRDLAADRLRRVFEREQHVNVCAAAVDVATEVGTKELLIPLDNLRDRFPDEPFLVFAIDVACALIRGNGAGGE